MKKKILPGILLLLGFALIITGCDTQLPSWDTTLNIPLAQDMNESMESILEDDGEIDWDEDDEDRVLRLQEEFEDFDMEPIEIGADLMGNVSDTLDEFEVEEEDNIEIPTLTLSANDLFEEESHNIYEGQILDIDGELDDLNIPEFPFAEAGFAEDVDANQMSVEVEFEDADFTIEDLTLTVNVEEDDDYVFEFQNIDAEDNGREIKTEELDTLDGDINIDASIETSGTTNEQGDLEINLIFGDTDAYAESDMEITYVEGLDITNIDIDPMEEKLTYDDFDFPAGLEDISFSDGEFLLDIDDEDIADFLETSRTIYIDGEEVTEIDGSEIDLEDVEIPFEEISIDVEIEIAPDDELDYYSSQSEEGEDGTVSFEAGFQDPELEEIVIDMAEIDEGDLDFSHQIDEEIIDLDELDIPRDFFQNITINDPEFSLVLELLEGLEFDLSDIEVTAYDENDNIVETYILPEDLEAGEEDGEVKLDLADPDADETTLIDLLQEPDASYIDIAGEINPEHITGKPTITEESEINIENLNMTIPFDFTFEEGFDYEFAPEQVDSLDEDDAELIESGLESIALNLDGLDNDTDLSVDIDFYLAGMPVNIDEDDEEALSEELYQDENIITPPGTISLEQRTEKDDTIEVSKELAQDLTEDRLFFGFKVHFPEGNYKLTADDEINLEEAYFSIKAKVNPGEQLDQSN